MKLRRINRSRERLISAMMGVGGVTALWWAGREPDSLITDIEAWMTSRTLLSTRQGLALVVLMLTWCCCVALVMRFVYSVVISASRWVVRGVARAAEVRQKTALGALLALGSGLITLAKSGDRDVDVGVVTDHALEETPREASDSTPRPNTPIATTRTTAVLPALASGGLAIALTSRIQRERERLLRDAPLGSRLRPPDSTAMVTGIALFETAKREGKRPPFDDSERNGSSRPIDTPLVVPLGIADSRLVSMQLHPGDTVSIDGEQQDARAMLRHVINTLACAPWLAEPIVIVSGFDAGDVIAPDSVMVAPTTSEAVVQAHRVRGATERPVVVVTSGYCHELDQLAALGVIVISSLVPSGRNVSRVSRQPGTWRVTTSNESFQPYGVQSSEVSNLRETIRQMTTLEVDDSQEVVLDQPYRALIRVLGPVEVRTGDGSEITFRKSKAMELLCWLAFHRDRPTVAAARTALWEIDVKDATFHNVLSEVRRGLSVEGMTSGVSRVGKHRLRIDNGILSDGDVLRATLSSIDDVPPEIAIRRLSEVLRLVRALPFCSTDYAWADAEGITSTLVWQITRAVQRTIEFAQILGDDASAIAAAAAGLRMSPGDEDFRRLQHHVTSSMVST